MAAASDVKILGAWASPFAMRPLIALNLKKIEYECLEQSLKAKSELLLESNPVYKKVPVLIHNGKIICESLIIVQYIDEVFTSGPSILPSDPYDRAIALFWGAYIDDKLFSSMSATVKAKGEEESKAVAERVIAGLKTLEEAFEKLSKGKGFFGGDAIGYIDIALGCFLAWLKVAEKVSGYKLMDETSMPSLCRWADKFCSDAAVKDLMPETDKLLEYAKMVFGVSPK